MSEVCSDIPPSVFEQLVCDLVVPNVLSVHVTRTEGCFGPATHSSARTYMHVKVYMSASKASSVAYQSVAKPLSYRMVYSTSR